MANLLKTRLCLLYFSMFTFIGVHMPFWPVWLKSRGIDSIGIAILTALSFVLKIVVTPLVSRYVDISGKKRQTVVWLTVGLLTCCSLFFFTNGFVQIFFLTALTFMCWSPIMSLAESITTVAAKTQRLDYGRIRLWGSISFMLVATFSGKLLHIFGEPVLLWSIVAATALLCFSAFALPHASDVTNLGVSKPIVSNAPFFQSTWFVVFLIATTLIQGSHAAYFTFSSIQWRGLGLSDQAVGLLWGASLIAEMVFFAFGRRLVDRLGTVNIILIGGIAATVRWCVIGLTSDLLILTLSQLLHAFSFGASHFAAMRIISERVDDSLSASGQGLYSAFIMGLGMGFFVLVSGPLYLALGAGAFFVMSLVAVIGTLTMVVLRRMDMTQISNVPVLQEPI